MAERTAAFNIHTDHQDVIESNAEEKFGPQYGDPADRAQAMAAGMVNAHGEITMAGWAVLNDDIMKLETNALAWLRKNFNAARDDGHDNYDDLVGEVWYESSSVKQASLIATGKDERIDMSDSSYGDLSDSVWDDVSDFGASVLGGAINFDHISPSDMDEIEKTLGAKRVLYIKGRPVVYQYGRPVRRR